ncbi:hypothetical protein O181_111135 [Austropuccinia psidii MF-1]|uniref:Uncharacterized protein n=1 Tax=Austropuccinia psidii MF-1 TaxID=1389203 RepID=A0A9Q3K1T4_9BASI|nr:hypothetical protein [Austropuccinia psidii MF-1]
MEVQEVNCNVCSTASVLSDSSSSSQSPSPGPLRVVLQMPGKVATTPENELDLLGLLPSFLDCAAPSLIGPLYKWPSVEELLGFHQEDLL